MNIERLALTNFEGSSANYKLGPVTLVTGANRSGKTSVTNAIRAAAYGYLPRLGPVKSRRLMSGSAAAVAAQFSDGTRSTVEWTKDAKGSVSVKPKLAHVFPDVLLDFGVWQKLTEAQRVAWAFQACFKPQDWDDDVVRCKLLQIAVAAPLPVAAGAVNAVTDVWRLRVNDRAAAGGDVPAWLDGTIAAFKETAKLAAQDAKTAQAQLVGLRAQVANKPADVSGKLDAAKQALATAQQRAGAAAQAARTAQEATSRLVVLRARRDNARTAAEYVRETEAQIKALTAKLVKVPHKGEDLAGEIGKLTAECDNYQEVIERCEVDVSSYLAAAVKIMAKDSCPTCKAEGEEWKTRWKNGNDKLIETARKEGATAAKDQVKAQKSLAALLVKQDARNTALTANGEVQRQIDALQLRLAADKAQAGTVAQLEADVAQAEKAAVPAASVNQAANALEELTETVRGLEQQDASHAAWLRAKETAKETEEKAVASTAKADAFKAAAVVVTDTQRETVAGLFGGLLAVANKFTEGFMPPVEFKDGEFGYDCDIDGDGAWVPTDTFSGTEELVAFAGLCVALAQSAPFKIVLLDELGRLEISNRVKLMARMEQLVAAGTLDQAVLVDTTATWLTSHQEKTVTLVEVKP